MKSTNKPFIVDVGEEGIFRINEGHWFSPYQIAYRYEDGVMYLSVSPKLSKLMKLEPYTVYSINGESSNG